MTPQQFIEKWRNNPLNERASYQLHFIDLCALVGVAAPSPATAQTYCFERGATRTGAGQGWADVWRQGYFGFEYKAVRRNLGDALKQLMTYALALENPPLLVVCDTSIIQIHTHFTNAPSEVHTIALEDISESENLLKLRWLFTDPDKFKPAITLSQITEQAAGKFADLAQSLAARGYSPLATSHFLTQCLFCLFAEDAGLLPEKLFERLLDKSQTDPAILSVRLEGLFAAMRRGGDFALENIHWFNGGLFENLEILPLVTSEIKMLYEAAKLDWSGIDPTIFGTLFERGLDPKKRAQLGAHYTDAHSIMRIIKPVIIEPLAQEWAVSRVAIAAHLGKRKKAGDKAEREAQAVFIAYLERLKSFRVLDPACGSGNFLFVALRSLKDLEHRANLDAEALGLQRQISIECSPVNVLGIEINPYAAELARVTVWIGEIQWMLKNGYAIRTNPILAILTHIENRDALLIPPFKKGGVGGDFEAQWPAVDVIIGNPPFLGGSKLRGELGDEYTEVLRQCYAGRVAGGADLVVYWFEKARAQIAAGLCQRAGLVSTNSIRGGSNQQVLARIGESGKIFNAWSDEEWVNDGAAVRVSLVCFGVVPPLQKGGQGEISLDGVSVAAIHADLSSGDGLNLTQAKALIENAGVAFQGPEKNGAFDIEGELARQWLKLPNPNARSNCDVLKPRYNGIDLARRYFGGWVIDFGTSMTETESALYEAPFQYLLENVKPERINNKDKNRRTYWWRFGRTGADMRAAVKGLLRYIATPEVTKHRIFTWMDASVLPDKKLIVMARADDTTFGILHSRFHELWALAVCTWHGAGNDPRYTPTTTFEAFPFPEGCTPADTRPVAQDDDMIAIPFAVFNPKTGVLDIAPASYVLPPMRDPDAPVIAHWMAIASAASALNKLRDTWLNPHEWVEWLRTAEELAAGYPLRPVARAGFEADLKKRTVTNLYNARPA